MMENLVPLELYNQVGGILAGVLLVLAAVMGISGAVNLCRPVPRLERLAGSMFILLAVVFAAGFAWICWFHYRIYLSLPLELPTQAAAYLNQHLEVMNRGAAYGLPLYDPAAPPRYVLPLWLENEKYYFWFMCFAFMGLVAHYRLAQTKFRAAIHILMAVQVAILFRAADPFTAPLPNFFDTIGPWFTQELTTGQRFAYFMQLYPKMVFYYNAEYMWFHPPLLFLSYACITMTFVTSAFMLVKREPAMEALGYEYAKLGFFMLTLGMLLGYPWALKAWGPNWWWDPKICSSIMMWAIYSTYLHTRLYANKPFMWYFSSVLGILCFLAMIFTFISSFFFPGEHTFV
ncbi:MAG: cytochrome c biogenesis protein CcsA [Desulfobulbaceae bacterium]|nr:cytochrome c biogenesis protein CcsA [Desulfobulbaceae bacterium]